MPDPTLVVETCANCRGPVSTTGPRPASGRRYCMKAGCRAAKQRERYLLDQLASGALDKAAPTECSCCGKALAARKWRAGDEVGRWCSKARCRRDRQEKRVAQGDRAELTTRIEVLEGDLRFLSEVVMAHADDYYSFSLEHCPDCGLTTAIPEWVHPNAAGQACWGTLGDAEKRRISMTALSMAWPMKRDYQPVAE